MGGGGAVSGYFKFSPMMSGSSFLELSSRRVAYGVALRFARRPISIYLDSSSLSLQVRPSGALSAQVATLGGMYLF
jgi:hypothetical protein